MPIIDSQLKQRQRVVAHATAIGSIGPAKRIERGEITEKGVREFVEALRGDEYDEPMDNEGPSAAGGTFTLVMADALTTNRFRVHGGSLKDHAVALYRFITYEVKSPESLRAIPRNCIDGRPLKSKAGKRQAVIGGHDAEDVTNEHDCGCGAEDKAADIVRYISERGDEIRSELESRGIEVDAETHQLNVENATWMLESNYVASGTDLRAAQIEVGGEACVATAMGPHNEVVKELNMRRDKTPSRPKLHAKFGDKYQVFVLDVAPLKNAAAVVSLTEREAHQKYIGALYFNVAAAAVLCDASLGDAE